MGLKEYQRKRKFGQTPEPKGKAARKGRGPLRFVVQKHDASRLHYDFRLEFGGVFKSWAVPKGPSLNPQDQRLAVFVEDHPLEYGSFEGIIPKGNYGGGTVMVWDEGTYVERGSAERRESERAMMEGFKKGHITFVMDGHKLKGEFALIQLKKDKDQKAWLLVKKRDEHSSIKRDQKYDESSVKTGRTLDEIAAESEGAGDVWMSKRNKKNPARAAAKNAAKFPPPRKAKRVSKLNVSPRTTMPRKNKPMIATTSRHSTPGANWIFEKDHGGLRALSEVEGKRVHIYSKSGLSFDQKFPNIAAELKQLELDAVLDGDIVKGRDATYHVYDILYHDGRDLREQPLAERKQILQAAFKDTAHVKHLNSGDKANAFIAKNPTSPYQSGTSADWLSVSNGPGKKKKPAVAGEAGQPVLTHLDKVYFPKDGYTKGDVLEYYEKIAPYILPYLKDRPESLNRHPNGIDSQGFYQKDMTGHKPRFLQTKRIYSESSDKSIDYVMVQNKESLLYIANLGCIEINPWFARVPKLDHPDFLVIDLDPDDDNTFEQVVQIAHEVHELLDDVGAANYCKTSGATGIHIGVPMGAKYEFDTVRAFAESICRVIQKKYPAITSMERSPARRRKKIYLDCLQNRRGQTLAAPYCIRPKPGAPVSMPVAWTEVTRKLKPEQFNIENALSRISKFDDPWAPVLGKAVNLERCIKTLERKLNKA